MYHGSMSADFNPLDWQLLYRSPERMHKKIQLDRTRALRHGPRRDVASPHRRRTRHPARRFLLRFLPGRRRTETPHALLCCRHLARRCHANHYKESVFLDLQRFHRRYESFSVLYRMTFDQALANFPDASVDLLHIDGLHTYDAVKTDFETWRRKLSDRAVVLFSRYGRNATRLRRLPPLGRTLSQLSQLQFRTRPRPRHPRRRNANPARISRLS